MLGRLKREFEEGKTLLGFGFLSASGQALGMVAPLVVAKFFSPALFGSYSLARMVVFFFTSFLIASAQTPFIVFANRERAKSGRINETFSAQCIFFVLSLCVVAVTTVLLSKYIMKFAGINAGDLFFVQLAFVGFALKSFISNLFMATGERMKNASVELVYGFLNLALVFVLYLLNLITLRTTLLIYLISTAILIAVFIGVVDFKLLLPFGFNKRQFKEMVNFTKWLMIGAVAAYLVDWGDNFVLRHFLSMQDIGTYNLGRQVFKGLVSLTLIIYSYFLPFVSEHIGDSDKMRDYLYNKRPKIVLCGVIIAVLIFIGAPYAFKLVYGNVYDSSITVFRILLVASVVTLYSIFYYPILNALERYKFSQTVGVVQVLLNLLLALLLVPSMGQIGAAIAAVLAYLGWAVIIEVYVRVKLKDLVKA